MKKIRIVKMMNLRDSMVEIITEMSKLNHLKKKKKKRNQKKVKLLRAKMLNQLNLLLKAKRRRIVIQSLILRRK
jgi:hypothetical protein